MTGEFWLSFPASFSSPLWAIPFLRKHTWVFSFHSRTLLLYIVCVSLRHNLKQ